METRNENRIWKKPWEFGSEIEREFEFVTEGDAVAAEQRDPGLEASRSFEGVPVNGRQVKTAIPKETQGGQIVIGSNQPQAAASGGEGSGSHGFDERTADAATLFETIECDDFTGVIFDAIGDKPGEFVAHQRHKPWKF